MKKAIIGLVAISAVVGVGLVGQRIGHKMRKHCERMAAQCKQMAARTGDRPEAVGRT